MSKKIPKLTTYFMRSEVCKSQLRFEILNLARPYLGLPLFGKTKNRCLTADREFIGYKWFIYLLKAMTERKIHDLPLFS